MPTETEHEQIRDLVESLANSLLEPYLSRLKLIPSPAGMPRGKELNDGVWGTIFLTAEEVVYLDSPLLQRLRHVRQLGVVDLVYPGANHTRFEHSVGTLHQIRRLISSINFHSGSPEETLIGQRHQRQLAIAALVHDTGHTAMSHVVEFPLSESDFFERSLTSFNRAVKKGKTPQLSEIVAYYIVRSPAFGDLSAEAARIGGASAPDPAFCNEIADLLIGRSAVTQFPQMHELVSGPFDADKLDYVPRDARYCGVPSATDVTRLTQKIRAVRCDATNLPRKLKPKSKTDVKQITVLGIAPSGANTLDEVALGRALLHEKVYGHHKVRSAESVVSELVYQSSARMEPLPFLSEVLRLGDAAWLRHIQESPDSSNLEKTLAAQLTDRRLPSRALPLAKRLIAPPPEQDNAWRSFNDRLANDQDARRDFVARVVEATRSILELLKAPLEELTGRSEVDLTSEIFLGGHRSGVADDVAAGNEVYVIGPDDRILVDLEALGRVKAWTDAHNTARTFPILFSSVEIATYVSLAAEVVLFTDHGFRVDRDEASSVGLRLPDCTKVREELAKSGYFKDELRALAPVAEVLAAADFGDRIAEICVRFSGYQLAGSARDGNGTKRRNVEIPPGLGSALRRWVGQFENEAAPVALAALEKLTFLDVEAIEAAFASFMESADGEKFQGANLVGLGGPNDGSAAIIMALRSSAERFGCGTPTLEQALRDEKPLLLVDDFVGTGGSAAGIFMSWMGLPNPLGEKRPSLTGELQEALRTKSVGVVWIVGSTEGVAAVRKACGDAGLAPTVLTHCKETSSVGAIRDLNAVPGYDLFVARARELAMLYFNESETTWDPAKRDQRLLGYGNDGLLLVFPYNTPTATLTCLWASAANALPAAPFPRRKKR